MLSCPGNPLTRLRACHSPTVRSRFAALVALPVLLIGCAGDGWRDARRDSAGLAPDPAQHEAAVVQVYAAAVYGWRGLVADHSWVTTKARGAPEYRRYEAIGWRLRRAGTVVAAGPGIPDAYWFGAEPKLLLDMRGEEAEALITRIEAASDCYPWADRYTAWPGPNSNTYVQWIALAVPELELTLPWRALGKNWLEAHHDDEVARC